MLVLRAPAKINLTLEVLDRRTDGRHGVRSLMVPLELADEITIEPQAGFSLTCDPALPDDADNLAERAFAAAAPRERNVRISLRKHVPVRAGLGGGSSDAAAILLAASEGAFGTPPHRDWLATARELGSDVPFFLAQTAALVEGTGERVTAAGAIPQWCVLIVKPRSGTSTADAYAALDARPRPSRPRAGSVTLRALTALQRGDFDALAACLHNDFQEIAAGAPEYGAADAALRAAGARHVLLAGSGSALFALTKTAEERDAIAHRLRAPAGHAVFPTAFARGAAWRG